MLKTNVADFEREGSEPFNYTRGKSSGRITRHALPYWRLPERLYDDPDELAIWAKRSFAIAERKKFGTAMEAVRKRSRTLMKGGKRKKR